MEGTKSWAQTALQLAPLLPINQSLPEKISNPFLNRTTSRSPSKPIPAASFVRALLSINQSSHLKHRAIKRIKAITSPVVPL